MEHPDEISAEIRVFFSDGDRVKGLVDGLMTEIFILDREGRCLYMNPFAAEKLSGRRDDLAGKHLWDVLPGEAADRMQRENLRALGSGRTHFCELGMFLPGGERIFKAILHPVRIGGSSEPSACFTVLRDVTEERKLSVQLAHTARLSAVGQLAAGVAHEFNNILAVIEGLAQIHLAGLEKRGQEPEVVEALKRIVLQSERASRITRQVQNFASPSSGERRPCRIADLLDAVVRLNSPQASLERVEVRTEIDPSIVVNADPEQLEQVFLNLMVNARHAILPKGGGRISIRAYRNGGQAEIRFEDNGIGMDEKTAFRVFEPFFTTKGSSSRDKMGLRGTGLGLAVCSSIMASHGGSIAVTSTEGQGSEFRVVLPLSGSPMECGEAGPVRDAGAGPDRSIPSRILIVEAEKDLAGSLAEILRAKGCPEVRICHRGADAVECVRDRLFDVILLDVSLPDAAVTEIIRSIRMLDGQVRIVCMTGRVDSDVSRWKDWGADGLLHKPFQMEEMFRCLGGVVRAGPG